MNKDIINMSGKELNRLNLIHKVLDRRLSQKEAADMLKLTDRHIRRIVKKIRLYGDRAIIHARRGKESKRKFTDDFKDKVVKTVKTSYSDFGPTLAAEKLDELDSIKLSRETLRKWMIEKNIWIPRKLKDKGSAHYWRKRKDYFGEMTQTDGSIHDWLEGRGPEMILMAYNDDATGNVFAGFYDAETTYAAMDSFKRYIKKYGIPGSLYFDRNSIYKTNRQPDLEECLKGINPATQFEKVINILDVQPIFAYSPQAKGRIERTFNTFQDRLIKEMRLAGVCDIKGANKFLVSYLPKYNKRFSVPPAEKTDMHRDIPKNMDLEWVFSFRETRTVSNDFTVRWKNRVFLISNPSLKMKRSKILVTENLKKKIRLCYKDRILPFKEITKDTLEQVRKRRSLMFVRSSKSPAKVYKPGPDHPWKTGYRPQSGISCKSK
ncbi:MAG: ISNCY family transposase [Elusimicrobiota bacterium]